jgi:hypothetical protein
MYLYFVRMKMSKNRATMSWEWAAKTFYQGTTENLSYTMPRFCLNHYLYKVLRTIITS